MVRLTLVNLCGMVEETVGKDSLIGLEIEARKVLKVKEAMAKTLESR